MINQERELRGTHLVRPDHRGQDEHPVANPHGRQLLALAKSDLDERDPPRLLERVPQDHVRPDPGPVGLDVVAPGEIDRVDLPRRDELQHVDRVGGRQRQVREVLIGEHDGLPGRQLVPLGDLRVRNFSPVRRGHPLVADAGSVVASHLMERHVPLFGGRVEPDRNRDKTEGDRAFPDRSHARPLP